VFLSAHHPSLSIPTHTPPSTPFNSASDAFRLRPDVASYGQSPSTPRDSRADAIAEETRLRDETAAFDASIADLETFAATRGALEDELGEKRALLSQRRVAHAARLEEIRRVRPVTHRSVSTFDRVFFQLMTGEPQYICIEWFPRDRPRREGLLSFPVSPFVSPPPPRRARRDAARLAIPTHLDASSSLLRPCCVGNYPRQAARVGGVGRGAKRAREDV
jgi:hypothetical protein